MADDGLISYGRRLTQLAEQHPDDTAAIFVAEDGTETPITWAELEARANQMADLLTERGLHERDVIVVALRNSPEHLFTTFASVEARRVGAAAALGPPGVGARPGAGGGGAGGGRGRLGRTDPGNGLLR